MLRAAAAALLLLAGEAQACNDAAAAEAASSVMLMTGLPLVWGEKGPFDSAARPQAAYSRLSEEFHFRPVDVLDPATLARARFLFLAQPQRLAAAELAALDSWIRNGGRALILTDPMLSWPSELPPGDIRRPPPVGMLGPLLGHWRLGLEAPAEPREVQATWNGRRISLESPGRFRSSGPDCAIASEGWMAVCRLGRGRVRLVADADLMRDSLWAPEGPERPVAENPAVVGEWLDELIGTARNRPRLEPSGGRGAAPALIAAGLAAVLAVIGLLLHRRRKR